MSYSVNEVDSELFILNMIKREPRITHGEIAVRCEPVASRLALCMPGTLESGTGVNQWDVALYNYLLDGVIVCVSPRNRIPSSVYELLVYGIDQYTLTPKGVEYIREITELREKLIAEEKSSAA